MAGEINGHTGWFPETYVEKVDDGVPLPVDNSISAYSTTEPVADTVSSFPATTDTDTDTAVEQSQSAYNSSSADGEAYISCYPYESTEPGDLNFDAGEYILVTKKDGDWWTGTIGDRTGVFPSNYVQEADTAQTSAATSSYYAQTTTATSATASQNYSDDMRNQEEADTEVSEINTQQKSDTVQDNYSRPMSTSSTTSVFVLLFFCCCCCPFINLFEFHRVFVVQRRVK